MTALPSAPSEEAIAAIPAISLRDHLAALRNADERFDAERDRRYTEVNTEKQKALDLSREYQTYKDEQANRLREQIGGERGLYPTKEELATAVNNIMATIKPLAEYVSSQQGAQKGVLDMRTALMGGLALFMTAVGIAVGILLK